VVARVRVNYISYTWSNHILSRRQVPDLGHRSKKRKCAQKQDLDCSDDNAVHEILMQCQARCHGWQLQEGEKNEESTEEQTAGAAPPSPIMPIQMEVQCRSMTILPA
jgi:hypothetical protein